MKAYCRAMFEFRFGESFFHRLLAIFSCDRPEFDIRRLWSRPSQRLFWQATRREGRSGRLRNHASPYSVGKSDSFACNLARLSALLKGNKSRMVL